MEEHERDETDASNEPTPAEASDGTAEPTDEGIAGSELRGLVVYSVAASLCPLIPVPILDDWLLDRIRRRLVENLGEHRGLDLSRPELPLLADTDVSELSATGCVNGCLRKAVFTPIHFVVKRVLIKMTRKILFFLAVKDAVDQLSTTFHHAWLVRHALDLGVVPSGAAEARTVRRAIDRARDEIDPRPVERTMRSAYRHSRRLLRKASRLLAKAGRSVRRKFGRKSEDEADLHWVDAAATESGEAAGGLVDELVDGIAREQGHLRDVQAVLRRALRSEGLLAATEGAGRRDGTGDDGGDEVFR